MRRIILQSELENIIKELLSKGYEGGYWDYKEDYTSCKEDKLIDIICMANNIEGRDAYLIYGADDNGIVKGIETTKEEEILDEEIEKLIEERQAARKNKDFARADEIRDQLLEQGIVLKDTREGVKWSRA
mgnify:CR=1 FL=1